MVEMTQLMAMAREMRASDIHMPEGPPPCARVAAKLLPMAAQPGPEDTRALILSLLTPAQRDALLQKGIDADFALALPGCGRQRVNVFCQQGRAAATLRLLHEAIPTARAAPM